MHVRLAELGELCTRKVRDWLAQGGPGPVKSIARLRQMAREILTVELAEINNIATGVLSYQSRHEIE